MGKPRNEHKPIPVEYANKVEIPEPLSRLYDIQDRRVSRQVGGSYGKGFRVSVTRRDAFVIDGATGKQTTQDASGTKRTVQGMLNNNQSGLEVSIPDHDVTSTINENKILSTSNEKDWYIYDPSNYKRLSASTLNVDHLVDLNIWQVGDKIRIEQFDGLGLKYGYVVAKNLKTVTIAGFTIGTQDILSVARSDKKTPDGHPYYLSYTPSFGADGSMTWSPTLVYAYYSILGRECHLRFRAEGTTGGTASNGLLFTLPVPINTLFGSTATYFQSTIVVGDPDTISGLAQNTDTGGINMRALKYDRSNFGLGTFRKIVCNLSYPI